MALTKIMLTKGVNMSEKEIAETDNELEVTALTEEQMRQTEMFLMANLPDDIVIDSIHWVQKKIVQPGKARVLIKVKAKKADTGEEDVFKFNGLRWFRGMQQEQRRVKREINTKKIITP